REPEPPGCILGDDRYVVAPDAPRIGRIPPVAHESIPLPVVSVEACGRSHPERPASIDVEPADVVGGDGAGVVRAVMVGPEGIPVVPVQAVLGPDPDESCAILGDGSYRVFQRSVVHREVLELNTIRLGGRSSARQKDTEEKKYEASIPGHVCEPDQSPDGEGNECL